MTIREQGARLYAALDAQDWDLLETLIARNVTIQIGSDPPLELEHWKAAQAMFYLAFPDGHHVIDAAHVDGPHFVTRCRFAGTHHGMFDTIAPTGKTVSVTAIHIDRFAGGRLVEHRGLLDLDGLRRQLAVA